LCQSDPGNAIAGSPAANQSGHTRAFRGADISTKLKLMGVDVASFGNWFADEATAKAITFHDPFKGVYKKLLFSLDGARLLGGILVGDASEYGQLSLLAKSGQSLPEPALELFDEGSARDALLEAGGSADLTALADDTQICNCHAVSKG